MRGDLALFRLVDALAVWCDRHHELFGDRLIDYGAIKVSQFIRCFATEHIIQSRGKMRRDGTDCLCVGMPFDRSIRPINLRELPIELASHVRGNVRRAFEFRWSGFSHSRSCRPEYRFPDAVHVPDGTRKPYWAGNLGTIRLTDYCNVFASNRQIDTDDNIRPFKLLSARRCQVLHQRRRVRLAISLISSAPWIDGLLLETRDAVTTLTTCVTIDPSIQVLGEPRLLFRAEGASQK